MSEQLNTTPLIKPVVILPKNAMSLKDMGLLREAGICVVECDKPEDVRYLDPPPMGYSEVDKAAIQLFRSVMTGEMGYPPFRGNMAEAYAAMLLKGLPPEKSRPPAVPSVPAVPPKPRRGRPPKQ